MPKNYYTPEEKVEALRHLRASMGDVVLTSQETGIPERTLRTWRHEYQVYQTLLPASPSPAASEPVDQPPLINAHQPLTADGAADEFESLRTQLMTQIMQMTADFPGSMESATSRAVAISRLLTWVFKLDEMIPAMRPVQEYIYRVEYKDPDGSIHATPSWSRKKFDDQNLKSDPLESDSYPADTSNPPDDASTDSASAEEWFA